MLKAQFQRIFITLGLIEDDVDAVQIDFANKMIGGGVLGRVIYFI